MITKAIVELNACVHALEFYRYSNDVFYHAILTDDKLSKVLERDIRQLKWEVVEDLLRKATKGTSEELYDTRDLDRFASSYVKYPEIYDGNYIANSFVDFYHDTTKECRRCSVCGRLMQEGYCQDGGYRYYCSDDCLHTEYSDEEWNKECDNNDQSYWTQWY